MQNTNYPSGFCKYQMPRVYPDQLLGCCYTFKTDQGLPRWSPMVCQSKEAVGYNSTLPDCCREKGCAYDGA